MYSLKRKLSLQKIPYTSLLAVLEESMPQYSWKVEGDTIKYMHTNHSFGLFYNSFLLKGEIVPDVDEAVLCKCELQRSVKELIVGMNAVLFLFLIIAALKMPEVLPTLSIILVFVFVGINAFAYMGLFISSSVFCSQITKALSKK